MKKLYHIIIAFLLAVPATAQDEQPTAAPSIKTFALQPDVAGAASNSVNLFTGSVALPLNLISLPGVNVSIAYNSNVKHLVETWNLEAPTGILGLGWSMDIPRIVADHKQTGAKEDDEYYLMEGGGSNKLIRTTSGYDAGGVFYGYETKQYQFWKIKYYYDYADISNGSNSGSNKWEIIKEDGTRYIYGDRNSERSTLQYVVHWNNWIGNSSRTEGQSQMTYIWNLSEIINTWNEKIIFEYENVEQFVGSSAGKKQTEASYLKRITDVLGRKVVFHYKDKADFVFNGQTSPFYMEPHTERAEPDAYQEVYERSYLDKIEVLRDNNSLFLSVQLGYSAINSGTNRAKMLLSSVIQKNSTGNALPGMQFTYHTSGVIQGFLQRVTYPTGGSISYAYRTSDNEIIHSDRELPIVAPSGYAEAKTWTGEDYVVVAWRQLGSNNTHDSNPRNVKLSVFQWVGEWKRQDLSDISGVSLTGPSHALDYLNFQVVTQSKFFAVLHTASNGSSVLLIRYKDEAESGKWLEAYTPTYNYGEGIPTLLSGTNFVVVGAYKAATSHRYVFQGNGWKVDTYSNANGDHFYTSANNYFIKHYREGQSAQFFYLTEDKKWETKFWGTSLLFPSTGRSYWHGSNSFAVCMAYGPAERAYRWNHTYTSFYLDTKGADGNELFGSFYDASPVYILNNSMVAIYGRLARFDGQAWRTAQISSTSSNSYSYGEDVAVRPTQLISSTNNYRGGRKEFSPNLGVWLNDIIHDGEDRGEKIANVGIDYYYFGNGYYYRQPNGSWVKEPLSTSFSIRIHSSYPRVDVVTELPNNIRGVGFMKNGKLDYSNELTYMKLLHHSIKFKNAGVGAQTIVAYPYNISQPEDATTISLYRALNERVYRRQVTYPVSLVTVNDGSTDRHTSYDYNFATATIDPSGTVSLFNEITVIPGSSSVSANKPYGYTKTFFYNGLSGTEIGLPSGQNVDLRWSGMPYKTEVYNSSGNVVSSTRTTYTTTPKEIKDGAGTKVEVGYYVRPLRHTSNLDGIETIATHSYDTNTGLLKETRSFDYDSNTGGLAGSNHLITRYKYFWEQYDTSRELNILTPVIETKQSAWNYGVEVVAGVSAVTWKNWSGVQAPHKTYQWKRTGSANFNFAGWSGTDEPAADWIKTSQIDEYDQKGNTVQVTVR